MQFAESVYMVNQFALKDSDWVFSMSFKSLLRNIVYRNWTLILTCYNQHPLHLRICFNQLYLKFHTDKLTLTCTLANKMVTQSCWNIIQFFHDWISFGCLQKTSFFKSKNNGWMGRRSKWITYDERNYTG